MIVPDAIEPIVGWRCWSLNDQWRLESLIEGRDVPWRPGVRKEAECRFPAMIRAWPQETAEGRPQETPLDPELLEPRVLAEHPELSEHEAPLESCLCGIYAAKDLETLRRVLNGGLIVGEVYLWGKVIPGELGYRAQYAYPKSLRLVTKGVPDHVLESLRAYCDDVGLMTPKEAWGSWGGRALRLGLMVGRMMVETSSRRLAIS